ncbi:MAG: glycoside hydrolase family 2 [Clostridia bacterium]|nr:glycoside hydrolase family 2 [Clostridia bacterium]
MNTPSIPRPEHPRPDFMRDTFLNLNGKWQFAFDDNDTGLAQRWYLPDTVFDRTILVPFAYQTEISGIGPTDEIHPVLWYKRTFTVPAEMQGRNLLLRFGAVDFACRVYINGQLAGTHEGGYSPFDFDITTYLNEGENSLCIRVQDDPDTTQPRGKQYWERGLMGCWYTPVSGIWQTVYLEAVSDLYIRTIHVTPDIDHHLFTAEITLNQMIKKPLLLRLTVSFDGRPVRTVSVSVTDRITRIPVDMIVSGRLDPVRHWSPEHPNLYDLSTELLDGDTALDHVSTYFGMRKIEVRDGMVYLNNHLLYQRLILDQGMWPESLLTPPSDEAIRRDIELTKAFGYNGARKHQKMEDPRYYYWADRLGLLVWGELPSAYDYSDDTVRHLMDTMRAFILRDFNHPSIICWVPLNESWGVQNICTNPRQQAAARMLYYLTKALDNTRLCSSNDGWEQVKTDLCALHDYAADGDTLSRHFESRKYVEQHSCDMRPCYAQGCTPTGREAFLITEYGGIAFADIGVQENMGGMSTWGYHDKVTGEEAFFERFTSVTNAIRSIPYCQGYCYTQLTDVMQEINGLLTPDRRPKVDPKRLASINVNPVSRG